MSRNERQTPRNVDPAGFTLVELLVVITIIGVLIALLLPAVQTAREAARRLQCANNFKQVGVAMHSYHSAIGSFPPGTISIWYITNPCRPAPSGPDFYLGWGWGSFILPQLEQQALYDQYDFDGATGYYQDPGCPNNLIVAATRIQAYLCPSDPQAGELVEYTGSTYDGHSPNPLEDIGMSNMMGVSDSRGTFCNSYAMKQFVEADGMMGNVQPCALADVRDGSSSTLMIGEVTGAGPGSHCAPYWLAWGICSTANGINGAGTLPGGAETYGGQYWGFSSYHPGGCHFLLGDGSVHFLSQTIDATLLAHLTTRAGGEPIGGGF